jgi:hypothetical protein
MGYDENVEKHWDQIEELSDLYLDHKQRKQKIRTEVRREYEGRIKQDIENRSTGLDEDFARHIRRIYDSGVSQTIIRREVLRTTDWTKWRYWRDLAGLPEQGPGYRIGSGPVVRGDR